MSEIITNNFRSVLIVDDDQAVRETVEAHIEEFIDDVYLAENLATAKAYLQDLTVDLLLLDIDLGGENGGEIIRFLLSEECNNNDINIIIISGIMNDEFAERNDCRASFLPKPFSREELIQMIESLVNQSPEKEVLQKLKKQNKPKEPAKKNTSEPDLDPALKKLLNS